MEIYKEIKGYENHYYVSNYGNVKTNNHYGSGREAILKPADNGRGYLIVGLTKNKRLHSHKIHRLVAEAFINNPENKPQVNHIDSNKRNNRFDNLEWCTNTENQRHYIRSEKYIEPNGELNGFSKLKELDVIEIRKKFIPRIYTRKMLAKEFNVTVACIKDVLSKRSWNHI